MIKSFRSKETEQLFAYRRSKRFQAIERHAALKPFLVELETLPNDIANEALLFPAHTEIQRDMLSH